MTDGAPWGLRPRLETVLRWLPHDLPVADVGAGDGQLTALLLARGAPAVVATELHPGAFGRLSERLGGLDRVSLRPGDGLGPLARGEVGAAAVAGMGEYTIGRILGQGLETARRMRRLVLQPMQRTAYLRRRLALLGLPLTQEDLAWEGGRFYQVLVVEPGQPALPWDPERSPLGPLLSHRQDEGARAFRREVRRVWTTRLTLTPPARQATLRSLLERLAALDEVPEGDG